MRKALKNFRLKFHLCPLNWLKRISEPRKHMAAEQDADPDGDGGSSNELRSRRSIIPFAEFPGVIAQHKVQNVHGAKNDQNHLEEKQESGVLLRSGNKKHHSGGQIETETQHPERQ